MSYWVKRIKIKLFCFCFVFEKKEKSLVIFKVHFVWSNKHKVRIEFTKQWKFMNSTVWWVRVKFTTWNLNWIKVTLTQDKLKVTKKEEEEEYQEFKKQFESLIKESISPASFRFVEHKLAKKFDSFLRKFNTTLFSSLLFYSKLEINSKICKQQFEKTIYLLYFIKCHECCCCCCRRE